MLSQQHDFSISAQHISVVLSIPTFVAATATSPDVAVVNPAYS